MLYRQILLIVATIMGTGCASTVIISDWHENLYNGPAVGNFLVIGLSETPNRRRFFETTFSEQLKLAGLNANPGFRIIPDDTIRSEKAAIEATIANTSADAILTTRLVDISREQSYVPPSYHYAYGGFYDYYYHPAHRMSFHPGYTVTNTTVILETNIYSAATRELLWTGSTRSFNPSSAEKIVQELAGIIVEKLRKLGFVELP